MSKFGKFLFKTALIGAAAYGAYYYLRKEEVLTPVVDDDDVSDFDEDLDGEPTKARSYVNLTFDKAKAEDLAKSAVKKAKDTITDSVQKVEEFFNDEPVTDEDSSDASANDNSSDATLSEDKAVANDSEEKSSTTAEEAKEVAKDVVEEVILDESDSE